MARCADKQPLGAKRRRKQATTTWSRRTAPLAAPAQNLLCRRTHREKRRRDVPLEPKPAPRKGTEARRTREAWPAPSTARPSCGSSSTRPWRGPSTDSSRGQIPGLPRALAPAGWERRGDGQSENDVLWCRSCRTDQTCKPRRARRTRGARAPPRTSRSCRVRARSFRPFPTERRRRHSRPTERSTVAGPRERTGSVPRAPHGGSRRTDRRRRASCTATGSSARQRHRLLRPARPGGTAPDAPARTTLKRRGAP